MGGSALILLLFTQGSVSALVVLYAINVFLTFSLSEFGMVRFFIVNRDKEEQWRKHISIHATGLVLCSTILTITIFEKFAIGGWFTLLITILVISTCYFIREHYQKINLRMHKFDSLMMCVPSSGIVNTEPVDPKKKTAIQLVSGFNGFGLQTFYTIVKNFPDFYQNYIFVSIAVIDSGTFKGIAEIHGLEESVKMGLQQYVDLARCMGLAAEFRMATGTDVVDSAVDVITSLVNEFSDSICFTGQIVFEHQNPFQRLLHNETAFAIQRRLQFKGITTVIMPIQAPLR